MAGVAVVVGVGPGIGMAVARRLAREGFGLALVALDAAELEGFRAELAASGASVSIHACDASMKGALTRVFDELRAGGESPEILVYNASVMREAPPSALDPEDLARDFGTNCLGALLAAQEVIPGMRRRERGTLLFTGGGLALKPSFPLASPSIGKGALRTLALLLAEELEPEGIHVATVTVSGFVQPGTRFDPGLIADVFWRLHSEEPGRWTREVLLQ